MHEVRHEPRERLSEIGVLGVAYEVPDVEPGVRLGREVLPSALYSIPVAREDVACGAGLVSRQSPIDEPLVYSKVSAPLPDVSRRDALEP